MREIRVIDLGQTSFELTQAVYHYLAERMTENTPDTVVLCRPDRPYLCLGYHQNYSAIFDREAIEKLRLPVMRRQIGGGATYLDADQFFYQFIFHYKRLPAKAEAVYQKLLSVPLAVLRRLNPQTRLRSVNELETAGRRIAGIGGGRINEAAVVVGNFLFDFDYETMSRVWLAPFDGFRSLAAQALRERVTTLRQLNCSVSFSEIKALFVQYLETALDRPLRFDTLSADELTGAKTTAKLLTSDAFLNLFNEDTERFLPLKIAADVFIHYEMLHLKNQPLHCAYRVRNDIIVQTAFQPESRISAALQQQLIGTKYADRRALIDPIAGAA